MAVDGPDKPAQTDVPDESALLDTLEREGKHFEKAQEIDRILKAPKYNGYDVLGLTSGVPEEDIRRTYRKKSLLIHPDKTTDPRAPDAFDRLKNAQLQLLDEKERARLDEAISDARMLAMRELKLDKNDDRVKEPDEEFKRVWKAMVFKVIKDDMERTERKARAQMQEEGRQQRKDEEEIADRKRKRDYEQKWEASRDGRIDSWRDFQKADKTSTKKKKPKIASLG